MENLPTCSEGFDEEEGCYKLCACSEACSVKMRTCCAALGARPEPNVAQCANVNCEMCKIHSHTCR